MSKEENPLLKVLKEKGYIGSPAPYIEITEPITEKNFKQFQDKLRSLVPPYILKQWDKEAFEKEDSK